MWWCRTALAVALLALGPSGCGFQPLYGKATGPTDVSTANQLASVRVRAIEDRAGQQLRNSLVQRLTPGGEPATPRYDLVVRLTKTLEGLGQQKDARSTLGRMIISANFGLVEPGNDDLTTAKKVGIARSVVSFNYLGARYASVTMERDAEERAIEELAESIRTQLGVHFAQAQKAPAQ